MKLSNLRKVLAKTATRRVLTGAIVVALASVGFSAGEETVSIILLALSTLWLGAEGDEIEIDGE